MLDPTFFQKVHKHFLKMFQHFSISSFTSGFGGARASRALRRHVSCWSRWAHTRMRFARWQIVAAQHPTVAAGARWEREGGGGWVVFKLVVGCSSNSFYVSYIGFLRPKEEPAWWFYLVYACTTCSSLFIHFINFFFHFLSIFYFLSLFPFACFFSIFFPSHSIFVFSFN